MDKKAIDKVSSQIYRKFPPVKNATPQVSKHGEGRYLLIFSGSGEGPDGKKIKHTVRVVASESGKILKISTSR